jgi:hypothetical protein
MPIGLTASGEMVFTILCKEFIELHREKGVEQKPAVEEQKVTTAPEETVARDEGAVPETTSAIDKSNRTDVSPKIKHELRQQRATNQNGCQYYQTYDAASETYRRYDSRRRSSR